MAAKRGLGTGLSALFENTVPEEPEEQKKETMVSLLKIEPRPDQPRKSFDQEQLEQLAESIKNYGLIQPITVRETKPGTYQIIAGERRWRAAKLAGLKEVPINLIEADDKLAQELALVENLQREDLNPIEEAKGYQTLIMEFGLTQEQTAERVGRSRPAVANALRLLNLPETIIEYLEDNMLTPGHARALLPLVDPELQLTTASQIIEKEFSVRQTEILVKKMLTPPRQTEEKEQVGIDYAQVMCDQLGQSMGRKVSIKDGKKRGKIEIEYYGADDREKLIAQLMKIQ